MFKPLKWLLLLKIQGATNKPSFRFLRAFELVLYKYSIKKMIPIKYFSARVITSSQYPITILDCRLNSRTRDFIDHFLKVMTRAEKDSIGIIFDKA